MHERLRTAFLFVFRFVVVPSATLFSLVSTIIMGTYSFKGSLFLITGHPTTASSAANVTIAEEFVRVTGGELAMAALFVLAGTLVALLAKGLKKRKNHQQFIDEVPMAITPNENQTVVYLWVYLRRCGDGERERTHLDEWRRANLRNSPNVMLSDRTLTSSERVLP